MHMQDEEADIVPSPFNRGFTGLPKIAFPDLSEFLSCVSDMAANDMVQLWPGIQMMPRKPLNLG